MDEKTAKNLVESALAAREFAYVPYSGFRVGAALLAADGRIFAGCNVENAAYGPTNCAERTAFFKAVSEGARGFLAIAVVGAEEAYTYPCGVCRQVMMEFCGPEEFVVVAAKNAENWREYRLEELLPFGFGPGDLKIKAEDLGALPHMH